MEMVVPVILQLAKLVVIAFALTVGGSTGYNISASAANVSVIPPVEGTVGSHHQRDAPSSASESNGSDPHPPLALPPLRSTLVPEMIKGLVPSLSPSNPVESPQSSTAPPPIIIKGHVPSSLPSIQVASPALESPQSSTAPPPIIIKGHAPSSLPSIQVASPPSVLGDLPSISPSASREKAPVSTSPVSVPGTAPAPLSVIRDFPSISPSASREKAPVSKSPVSLPGAPVPALMPLRDSPQISPAIHPSVPIDLPPYSNIRNAPNKAPIPESFAPVPVATPSRSSPQNSPAIHPNKPSTLPPHAYPRNSSNNKAPMPELTAPVASPPRKLELTPPSIHPVMPRLTPSGLPKPVPSPMGRSPQGSPAIHPIMPGESPSILPDHDVSPIITPTPSINGKKNGNSVAAPPNETPKALPPVNQSPNKDHGVSPIITPTPSINKREGIPVSAPPNETPKPFPPANHSPNKGSFSALAPSTHKGKRHSNDAPVPSFSSPKSSLNKGYHSPASSPSPFYKHHQLRNKITSPAPASTYLISPPPSKQQGPVIPPSYLPGSRRRHYAPSPLIPVSHVSPASSPSPTAASGETKMPVISPKVSPSGSSSRSPKMPLLPPIRSLPPPPPNEDCSTTVCTEPYTNTPPGSPCGCVLPMQVALRLSVALYTFFPLVSELAEEIAAGAFMKQSQVRIMGANAASEQPDKTVVLIDLVPLGEKFDNTTAFLTYQRFWHKQVTIKAPYFGDYEVLYVRYPGLPPSPPSSPSSINIEDDGPYSGNDNNARTTKPLGVDVPKKRHKNGLSGGMIAIVVLSTSVGVIICSAVAWVLLFKHRDHPCQPVPTPQPLAPSLTKPSGSAGSVIGSGLSSISLSFGSSIAPYTGSAKTFSASDMERATGNFETSRILGEGGFGRVYSGVLEDGTKVAVKVLKRDDQQGGREFLAEVEMLSRLHHRNLVKLIGICTEERIRCLVYELIPNGSVESHLHGVDKGSAPLDWDARIKIALGAARGLAYLHEDSSPRVIHRDFKSSNILLEHDFTPKVSDFGLARTAMDEENRHISTRVMGTFGYVAPEYAMTGHLLVKSDVYSYGVVLLELLTGRKPVDMSQPPGQENLVAFARPLLTSKEGLEAIIDSSLGSDVPFDSVAKVAAIASMCVQPEVSHRPFMGEVVQALKLVCNECDEAKEVGSRSSSQDDLSIDMGAGDSTCSGQLPDPLQGHHSVPNYDSEPDTEKGLFSASARFERQPSGSFRRHSSSGPLRTGRGKQFWQRIRRLSGGSVSEHGVMFRLWQGSH